MTIEVFVILWFCREDDPKLPAEKVGQAHLYPIGAVTLGVLFALSGIGNRAFYYWLDREQALIPQLPGRTGLVHLFTNNSVLLNHRSLVVGWAWDTTKMYERHP